MMNVYECTVYFNLIPSVTIYKLHLNEYGAIMIVAEWRMKFSGKNHAMETMEQNV